MTEFTLGVAIACGIIGVAALFMFRGRIESIGRSGIRLRPSDSDQRHAQAIAGVRKEYEDTIAEMARSHSETDAKNQKTIASLRATVTANEAENARLKALIPPPEKPFKGRYASSFLPDDDQQ